MPFQMEKQLETLWCWAAVAMSVDHYFSTAAASTQCGIAGGVLGLAGCCGDRQSCNRVARLQDALNAVGRLREIRLRPLRFDEIQQEIDAQLPVCARIEWTRGAHFVVISGYRTSASGIPLLNVADPHYPNSTLPYDVFVSAYQNAEVAQGGGRWTDTFLVDV